MKADIKVIISLVHTYYDGPLNNWTAHSRISLHALTLYIYIIAIR